MIDFEGFSQGSYLPYGYTNLNWSNAAVFSPFDYGYRNTGYNAVLNSGVSVAFGGYAFGFSSPDPNRNFDFKSGYFAAAWHNNLQVTFTAFDNGFQVGSATFSISPTKTFIDFTIANEVTGRFTSIDRISIDSVGGTNAGLGGGGAIVAMDDLTLIHNKQGDPAYSDQIDVPDGMNVNALLASASYDAGGNVVLHHGGGTLTLLGVTDASKISVDWFV